MPNSYKLIFILLLASIIGGFQACKHEPIVPPGQENGNAGGGSGGSGGGDGGDDGGGEDCDPNTVYFQQDVLPIFQSSCALSGCHDAATAQDDIILTDYWNIVETGDIDVGEGDLDDGKIYEMITETDIDDPEDIMPPQPNDPLTQDQINKIRDWILQGAQNNSCEPTSCNLENVTYSGTIRPIIVNHCEGCHSGSSPSGGLSYETYDGVANVAADGRLLDAVTWADGINNMPQNGDQLSDCKIEQITIWIENGYQDD